jgi:hypothetical protein
MKKVSSFILSLIFVMNVVAVPTLQAEPWAKGMEIRNVKKNELKKAEVEADWYFFSGVAVLGLAFLDHPAKPRMKVWGGMAIVLFAVWIYKNHQVNTLREDFYFKYSLLDPADVKTQWASVEESRHLWEMSPENKVLKQIYLVEQKLFAEMMLTDTIFEQFSSDVGTLETIELNLAAIDDELESLSALSNAELAYYNDEADRLYDEIDFDQLHQQIETELVQAISLLKANL